MARRARLLNQLLKNRTTKADSLTGLPLAFFAEGLRLVGRPWNESAIPDLVCPETRSEQPADLESRIKYNAALNRTAMQDADAVRSSC